MNKAKLGGIGAVVVFLGFGIVAFLMNDPADNATDTQNERIATDPSLIDNPGSFVEYSEVNFANATESKKVLFFHSITCFVCDQIERNMKAGVMPENVALFKVRLEKEDALIEKYDVNQQTTFIQVDDEGNSLKEWNWLSRPFAGPQDLELEVI